MTGSLLFMLLRSLLQKKGCGCGEKSECENTLRLLCEYSKIVSTLKFLFSLPKPRNSISMCVLYWFWYYPSVLCADDCDLWTTQWFSFQSTKSGKSFFFGVTWRRHKQATKISTRKKSAIYSICNTFWKMWNVFDDEKKERKHDGEWKKRGNDLEFIFCCCPRQDDILKMLISFHSFWKISLDTKCLEYWENFQRCCYFISPWIR